MNFDPKNSDAYYVGTSFGLSHPTTEEGIRWNQVENPALVHSE
jgi:hypothetical protein